MQIRALHALTRFLLGALFFAGVSVHAAANFIVNGDFETGDFSGWTQFGNTAFTGVDNLVPFDGTYAAFFGPGSPGGIFQVLATTPGKVYHIEFWLMNESDVTGNAAPNTFSFNWDGGGAELVLTNEAAFGYTHYAFSLLATSATTDLRFTFEHVPAFWDLDAVSAVIPEPGSLALLALAGGLAALARRRRAT